MSVILKADKNAVERHGCEDKKLNNCRCDSGVEGCEVVINGQVAAISRISSFNGILHYGITGNHKETREFFCGWIPAFLCDLEE